MIRYVTLAWLSYSVFHCFYVVVQNVHVEESSEKKRPGCSPKGKNFLLSCLILRLTHLFVDHVAQNSCKHSVLIHFDIFMIVCNLNTVIFSCNYHLTLNATVVFVVLPFSFPYCSYDIDDDYTALYKGTFVHCCL